MATPLPKWQIRSAVDLIHVHVRPRGKPIGGWFEEAIRGEMRNDLVSTFDQILLYETPV